MTMGPIRVVAGDRAPTELALGIGLTPIGTASARSAITTSRALIPTAALSARAVAAPISADQPAATRECADIGLSGSLKECDWRSESTSDNQAASHRSPHQSAPGDSSGYRAAKAFLQFVGHALSSTTSGSARSFRVVTRTEAGGSWSSRSKCSGRLATPFAATRPN
jgi:hypothetical protein